MILSENEKDEYIRKRFLTDTVMVSGEKLGAQIKKDIDTSKIKVKKYTYVERRLMLIMAILLIISLASNAYLIMNRSVRETNENQQEYTEQRIIPDASNIIDKMENVVINDISDEEEENQEDPIFSTVIDPVSEENEIPNELAIDEGETSIGGTGEAVANEEAIKSEIKNYSMTIGRYGDDADILEKNTILLLIANDFFNGKVSKNTGLEIGSNNEYAMTADNVHLFIKELTGTEIEGHLDSFINYMKYNDNSKFYSAGTEITKLKDEKYEVTSMNVKDLGDGEYKVIGNINRKSTKEVQDKNKVRIEDVDANYSFEAIMAENNDYTYVQYKIKDFKTELKPGDEDNIIRIFNAEQIEEQKNTKKKK